MAATQTSIFAAEPRALVEAARRDLVDEFVVTGNYGGADSIINADISDDVTERFGPETYDRMLNDPEVSARMESIKILVLGDGIQTAPAVREDDPRYARAKQIEEFIARNFKRVNLRQFCYELLDGLAYGHKVGEITYDVPTRGIDEDKLVLKYLKVKPRRSVSFVMDAFKNIRGFLARRRVLRANDKGFEITAGTIEGRDIGATTGREPRGVIAGPANAVTDERLILPRIKFVVFTFRGRDNDPRGQSLLRPAYNAWNFKTKLFSEWMLFLCNYAMPSVIGIAAPEQVGSQGEPSIDEKTGQQEMVNGRPKFLTAVQRLGQILGSLRKKYAAAVPNGTTFEVLDTENDGSAFTNAMNKCDGDITTAMTLQTLALKESKYMSRNAATTHASMFDAFIWFLKQHLLDVLTTDVVTPLVDLNEDEDALELLPILSAGDTERRDWAKEAAAAAQLINTKQITPRMLQEVFMQLGFSPPSLAELQLMTDKAQEQANLQQQQNGNGNTGNGKPATNKQRLPQAA